jgi:hypothetical protein
MGTKSQAGYIIGQVRESVIGKVETRGYDDYNSIMV